MSPASSPSPEAATPGRARWIRWVVVSILIGLGTVFGLHFVRGYPWLLALFSGIAVGALSFTTLLTLTRLREQLQERRW